MSDELLDDGDDGTATPCPSRIDLTLLECTETALKKGEKKLRVNTAIRTRLQGG